MSLGFYNSQLFGLCNTVELGSFRPRSQKHRIHTLEPAKTPAFNAYNLNNMNSGFYGTIPRNIEPKFLSFDPPRISSFNNDSNNKISKVKVWSCKGNKDFVLRSKSVLSVDKEVETEGNEGLSREKSHYDAIVIGSGIGGLVAATQLAVKGARVLVLEKYVIPGGSSGYYKREGYTFDVGSSVMFGFSDKVSCLLFYVSFVMCVTVYLLGIRK